MTTWPGWALRRARASALLLATLFALVAVTTGILAFALGNAGALATAAARAAISSADPSEAGVRAQTRMAPDPDAQDALARSQLTEGFAPAPITIWTTFSSEPRPVTAADGSLKERFILWAGEHLGPETLEVDGAWPTSPTEAALHAEAATRVGIEVGETLTVDDHELTVTALWRAQHPSDAGWFEEPLVLQGADGVHLGPLVVDRSVLIGGQPFVRWGVVPDAERITADQLGALAEGAERAKTLVAEADITGRGITVEGDLASTATRAAHELAVGEAFGFVPVSLLLLVAVVGLIQVAGLLATTRERELQLLFARGSSPGQVVSAGVAEALVVALLGAAVGTGLASAALWITSGTWAHTPAVLRGGHVSLGIALLCLIGVALNAAWRAARGGQARSDRVKAVAGAAALVLVSAAAALATWQLRSSGSFVRDFGGTPGTDLVPALSPALLLAAAAVVGLVVLAPVTRLLEFAAHRTRSTTTWLAGAQLARGLVVQAVPVVLTILATGTTTFAALYAGTGAALARDVTSLGQGAPLRATLEPSARDPLDFPTLDGVPGVTANVPVWIDANALIGDVPLTALAAPMDALGDVAALPGEEALPTEALLLPAAEGPGPVALPEGAATMTVDLTGALSLDPWQLQTLQFKPEFHRAIAETLPAGERETQVRFTMDSELQEATKPWHVATTLLLRDPRTGQSAEVPGPRLQVPAAEVTHTEDYSSIQFIGPTGEASVEIGLPQGRPLVLDAIRLDAGTQHNYAERTIDLTLSVTADGEPVLGADTANWSADEALTTTIAGPYLEAEAAVEPEVWLEEGLMQTDTGGEMTVQNIRNNRPHPPLPMVDPTAEAWRVRLPTPVPATLTVGPGVAFAPVQSDTLGVAADAPRAAPIVVPVALTPALSEASTMGLGDTFEATLYGRHVPVEVVAITESIPGLTSPMGLLVDSGAWSASRAAHLDELVPPTELWGSLDGDPAAARDATLALPGVASVLIAENPTDAAAAPAAQAFWIAAASALVLAMTGLAAATATQLTHRRPEVAVLRALGMTPGAQGRSRAWEIGGILALATAAGIAAGWLAGWLIVDPVIRSSSADDVAFPTHLTLDAGPWLILLGLGAAAVAVILALLARAVRRQALDNEYREEVR